MFPYTQKLGHASSLSGFLKCDGAVRSQALFTFWPPESVTCNVEIMMIIAPYTPLRALLAGNSAPIAERKRKLVPLESIESSPQGLKRAVVFS